MPKHSDLLECFKYVQILNISLLEERLWMSSGYQASQILRKSSNHAQNLLNFVFLLGGLADYAWRAVFRVPVRRAEKTFKYAFHIAFIVDICEAKKRQMIAYSFTSDANQMCSWQQNHS